MTSALFDSERATTLLPFALWTCHGSEASVLAQADLPHLRAWLAHSRRVAVQIDTVKAPLLATLTPPHEQALAQVMGWPAVDGAMPWAAQAAAEQGLTGEGWAFITLCHWQVSHGQVTLGDPEHLHIDAATDAALFQAMQGFFAEDGIALHSYRPGQWLAQSPHLTDLPTASLDRVIGRNIDPWLVGSEMTADALSPAAKLLRRLQNEMQMLLYTHAVNDGRALTINSFWVHGSGAFTPASRAMPEVVTTLRASALQQDLMGWLDAWQQIDAAVMAPMNARVVAGAPQRLVLCGAHAFHVYDSVVPSLWQRLRSRVAPPSLDDVLAEAPWKD